MCARKVGVGVEEGGIEKIGWRGIGVCHFSFFVFILGVVLEGGGTHKTLISETMVLVWPKPLCPVCVRV